jgi:hypothetical protein
LYRRYLSDFREATTWRVVPSTASFIATAFLSSVACRLMHFWRQKSQVDFSLRVAAGVTATIVASVVCDRLGESSAPLRVAANALFSFAFACAAGGAINLLQKVVAPLAGANGER